MNVVCDSSSIISLGSTCVIDALRFMEEKAGTDFLIPPAVQDEIVGHAFKVNKYRFSALRMKNLVREGVLDITEPKGVVEEGKRILDLANSIYSVRGRSLPLIQAGEAECLALFKFVEGSALMVDEKTTRLLIEDPEGLRKTIRAEYKEAVALNEKALSEFGKAVKGIKCIRSTELLWVAVENGFFDRFDNDKEVALKAALHCLRRAGCSISHRELDEYESL